ncbi:MAG: HAD family phosphatase [Caulobacteraceae bacterium]|nr:HAD family phosphatase [Caulobacteraceae bacterium]
MKRNIRLLIADVDGTLVTPEHILTEASVAAAHDLRVAGVALAIVSGRPPRGMRMLAAPLSLAAPMAGFNGGLLVNPDLSVIETHLLDGATAAQALQLLESQGLDAWLYTPQAWLIRDENAPHVAREAATVQFGPEVRPAFAPDDLTRAVKIVGVSDDLDKVAGCEAALRQRLAGAASAARSQPYYLDVTHPKANKGTVADTLAARLGLSAEEIATIGDMPSDVAMFRRSGLSIAMGNAADEVKAEASAVTDRNTEDGFAKAVRRFVLASAAA